MNKKLVTILLGLGLIAGVTSCGETPAPSNNQSEQSIEVSSETSSEVSEQIDSQNYEERQMATHKSAAISKLDELVNPVIAKITDEEIKTAIQNYYDAEKLYINGITSLDEAKEAVNKVIADTKEFAVQTLKPIAVTRINSIINPLIEKITREDLKVSVQSFYDEEMSAVSSIESLDDVATVYKKIIDDTKAFIVRETEKILTELKNKALEELDPYVTTLIGKIPYDSLKTDVTDFYGTEKDKLAAVDSFEGIEPCVNEIKDDLEKFALDETKKIAVSKLEEVVNAGLDKIPNQDLKADLQAFSQEEIAKLNAVTAIEDVPTTLTTVLSETSAHIKELLVSTVKNYISRLTAIESATAYDYLPEAMTPMYSGNLVSEQDINYDFTSFTNISDINKAGYGEQWQMVIDNINQSVTMAKVFNVAQTALSSAGAAIDIYLTNSYADEMSYEFGNEETKSYNGLFEFKNNKLVFNLNISKSVELPLVGTVQPVIKMEYDLATGYKTMYISLGDTYKISYTISDNFYEMATTYGITIAGKSGSRSSYLSIEKSETSTVGHIYEYTTIQMSEEGEPKDIAACADFYIENGYVSVVGNKASGIIALDSYINELYKADEGRLLGYEVREEKSFTVKVPLLGEKTISGTYNTLWFNLWDIQGINNVKVTDKTDDNKSSKSTCDVYLNNSTALLSPTYNKQYGVTTSRKYDVELRTRYYYTYDAENGKYIAYKVEVPMMFIQEDNDKDSNYSDFPVDMLKDNSLNVSVSLNQDVLNKILADYDELIDIFIQHKENMSSEQIISYLSEKE